MRVALLALLIMALAACNSTVSAPELATVTPQKPTVTSVVSVSDGADSPASTETTSPKLSTAGSETIDCGEVVLNGNPPHAASDSVQAASACFLNAFNACQAATLTVRGPDSGVTRQFSIESAAKCLIHQALQPDPTSPPALVDCESVEPDGIGMTFSNCSHLGDFSVTP